MKGDGAQHAALDVSCKPRARTSGLTHQRVDDELLIYDHGTFLCHRLGDAARKVFDACNGQHSLSELAVVLGLPLATVAAVAVLLSSEQLIDDVALDERVSRRTALTAWATGVAGGIVATLIVPSAAQAASCISLGLPGGGRPCCPGLILNFLGICVPIG